MRRTPVTLARATAQLATTYPMGDLWLLTCILYVCTGGACMAFSILSVPKRIHKTFANLRTGIVLLILVVIASALGTVILQRPATDPDKLSQAYSPAMLRF